MTQLTERTDTATLRRYIETAHQALQAVSWKENEWEIPIQVGNARAYCGLALEELERLTERRGAESIAEER